MLKLVYRALALAERHKTKKVDFTVNTFYSTNRELYFTLYKYWWTEKGEIAKSKNIEINNKSYYKFNLYKIEKFFNED